MTWKKLALTDNAEHVKHRTLMVAMAPWYDKYETDAHIKKRLAHYGDDYCSFQYDDGDVQVQLCFQYKHKLELWKIPTVGFNNRPAAKVSAIVTAKIKEFLKSKGVDKFFCIIPNYEEAWIRDIVEYWKKNDVTVTKEELIHKNERRWEIEFKDLLTEVGP